jgi:hypothetical protein
VDVVVVTTIDHNVETPSVAMKRFEPFLDRHYKDKWTPQDRSFAIELSYVDLDLVVTALPTDPATRAILEKVYRSQAVATELSLEDRQDWVLNKSWDPDKPFDGRQLLVEDASTWRDDPLMLPDRPLRDWGPTHPLAQIEWAAEKNRKCNGHYVNVVRSIKWWRLEHADELPKYPKGYPLEHMVGYVLPDGIGSVPEGVVKAFEGIRDRFSPFATAGLVPELPDHGVPTHNVLKRLTPADFRAFHVGASAAAALARRAIDEPDRDKSGALWRELLGPCFPLPGSRGGDRGPAGPSGPGGGGFTKPVAPARPRQTDRFA